MSAKVRPHPTIGARVPMSTQKKAKIKAIKTNMSLGQYVTQLIEDDCEDIDITPPGVMIDLTNQESG